MVLGTLISHPELLNRETLYELRSIVARYPYFQAARILMLRNLYLLHDPDFGAELRRSVLYVNDRRALCRLIEGYTDKVMAEEHEVVDEPTVDRTMSLIDAFLGTLPEEQNNELVAVETVGDYAAMFLSGEGASTEEVVEPLEMVAGNSNADSVLRAIELMSGRDEESGAAVSLETSSITPNVLSKSANEGLAENFLRDSEDSLDESYFTETLAKIYIKQRKYSRALEIIRSLYLQFPEKNAYFADQIRFLEKLIINNNLK